MVGDEDSKPPSKKDLNRAHHADRPYGNYHNYYFHRPTDDRLSLLPSTIFSSKKVLDLGCNAGKISIESVARLGAASALGIDIDPVLIDQATRALREHGQTAEMKVDFRLGDFMERPGDFFAALEERCETVLLLSITKWLHLQHGDEGLENLFVALYDYLPSGGTLVIEPQEWENYKSACKKNRSLRPIFKTLQMRPPFEVELRRIGFTLERTIKREEGGFSRPLLLWKKA